MSFKPGDRVQHKDFGQGIVVSQTNGSARVFFQSGEHQVPSLALVPALSQNELVISNAKGGRGRFLKAWLHWKAFELPLLDAASSLTSAKIDLLPHQVVLTHRIATSMPRRFLIADEVGLGKTIEAALILRELSSRGELNRALMVVPAGLVNNWHRELNEVFNLNFEVFGREGDVSDRRSNAFAKHNFLIASIDTLKRPERVKRLLEAAKWDLVIFDEAHHLTAYKQGGKTKKTHNYKLAEALRDHSRDLILLSATPHQGDHFRFWKLIHLLDPTLFENEREMVEQRHRLNPFIFRRTKADACQSDGSPLFARRWVHTEAFGMADQERRFYHALNEYLRDGFALAKTQGGKGRALGFVMTIFQKIAASSFAAVHRTLRRRLIALTVHEGLVLDGQLDIDGRDSAFKEARALIREEWQLEVGRLGDLEVDRILNELKRKILKKLDEEALELASDAFSAEMDTAEAEDAAMNAVNYALPEERNRIKTLLNLFPKLRETKVDKLLTALGVLWRENTEERVVIFATYLGTVEMLGNAIEEAYPGQGVVVLKGGDHGSKLAAEKRFKKIDGPRVMICTAAGREGINLQHARVLFNFDLPWNPMDVEQRIGRIHRYGQKDTAQVYNLVLGDTIEGRIFLLLDEKLADIAKTLGKVDEQGNVAEDLRSQILGQLSEKINYQTLYSEALQDPELKRTRLELEAAMSNANEARSVVYELFQDLDRFTLSDYVAIGNVEEGMGHIVRFIEKYADLEGWTIDWPSKDVFQIANAANDRKFTFTTSREKANVTEGLELLGLDHPFIADVLGKCRNLPPEQIGIVAESNGYGCSFVCIWSVEAYTEKGSKRHYVLKIASSADGSRVPALEKRLDEVFDDLVPSNPTPTNFPVEELSCVLDREIKHRGLVKEGETYSSTLIGWLQLN